MPISTIMAIIQPQPPPSPLFPEEKLNPLGGLPTGDDALPFPIIYLPFT